MKLIWSRGALLDLQQIIAYLETVNSKAALLVLDRIDQAVKQLERFPQSGKIGRHSYELVISGTPYITAYDLSSIEIELLALIHGARRWSEKL